MAKRVYLTKRLKSDSLDLIERMNEVIATYQAMDLSLTLRQLYYRLVAAGDVPNTQLSYNRVGRVLSNGRLCGLVDWDAIEDRGRAVQLWGSYDGIDDYLRSIAWGVAYDHWHLQPEVIEVWVEKEALIEVVGRACTHYRVPHFACKGYVSQSALYRASTRIARRFNRANGYQPTRILYLGDHDPSGLDMPRDLRDRLHTFEVGDAFTIDRIALLKSQIRQYDPPPNPAKVTDSRFKAYRREHGDESWELDALEPQVLTSLIKSHIEQMIGDPELIKQVEQREMSDSSSILALADRVKRVGWTPVLEPGVPLSRIHSVLTRYMPEPMADEVHDVFLMETPDDDLVSD